MLNRATHILLTCLRHPRHASLRTMADVASKTQAALRKDLFIGGKWVAGAGPQIEVLNPATGAVLGHCGGASTEQVDAAVKAAAHAFKSWRKTSDAERAGWMRKLADEVASRKPHIAAVEALNTGKPFREAEGDVDDVCGALRYCAGVAEKGRGVAHIQPDQSALDKNFQGSHIIYEPVGVVAAVLPWNFPAMMIAWKIASALGAGCTIVAKPSEFTPFSSLELAAAAEAIGFPAGVLNIVNGVGAVGAALVEHELVDKVSFTGSLVTGSRVMGSAAKSIKRVTLELGGKSPAIVFPDANLDAALEWVLFGAFFNTGQICSATARVLVHESIAGEVTARLVKAASRLKQGSSFEEGVEIGPSCNKMQYEKVQHYIALTKAEAGAELLLGGGRPEGEQFKTGFWTAPTIFKVTPSNTIFTEEVFGPVMSITTFKTAEEALELANASTYGLAAAVFTADASIQKHFAEELRAGVVWVNNAQPSPHAMPWGGFKRSGLGRELGPLALLPFLEVKAVTVHPMEGVGWYPASHFST